MNISLGNAEGQRKKQEIRKCYKYNKEGHLAKDYKSKQPMKNRRNQTDNPEDKKEERFIEGLEQAQYNKPLYIINIKINILFQTKEITKKGN